MSRPAGRVWLSAFQLIALTFIRTHVAAASVLRVGTRLAALIGLQQMAKAVGAATRVARIDRWATGEQSLGLCWPAIVLQRAEQRVRVFQVARVVEVARTVTT